MENFLRVVWNLATESLFVYLKHNNRYKTEILPDDTIQQFKMWDHLIPHHPHETDK